MQITQGDQNGVTLAKSTCSSRIFGNDKQYYIFFFLAKRSNLPASETLSSRQEPKAYDYSPKNSQ
jgi:hypothetical protein